VSLQSEKTGKARHFITVGLRDDQLAKVLDKHGVKYSAAVESQFLGDLIFMWIISFAMIFLLRGYLGRKMGGGPFFRLYQRSRFVCGNDL